MDGKKTTQDCLAVKGKPPAYVYLVNIDLDPLTLT